MLDLLAAGQEVEGDVQDVVALVVRQVPLEDVDVGIDGADQPGPTRQQEHGADAPGGEAPGAIGQLVVDVGGGHHGRVALRPGPVEDAVEDPPLPLVEDPAIALPRLLGVALPDFLRLCFRGFLGIVVVTRKPSLTGIVKMCSYLHYSRISEGFRAFSRNSTQIAYTSRLVRD